MWVWWLLPASIFVAGVMGVGVQKSCDRRRRQRLRDAAHEAGFDRPLRPGDAPYWPLLGHLADPELRISEIIAGDVEGVSAWLVEIRHRLGPHTVLILENDRPAAEAKATVTLPAGGILPWPGEGRLLGAAKEELADQLGEDPPMFLYRDAGCLAVGACGAATPSLTAAMRDRVVRLRHLLRRAK